MPPAAAADIGSDLAAVWDDPVAFAHGVFPGGLWSRQEEILRAIAVPHARVSVKGCHASAKTHAAARAALWFLARFEKGIVVTTAPKEKQLEMNLWKEIHACLRTARLKFPEPLSLHLTITKENYMTALVARDAERFQGVHAPQVLFIVDEAPGVGQHIFVAMDGAAAGGDVRVLELGNPTIIGGAFYDHHTRLRATWKCISISAFDTPNLQGISLDEIRTIEHKDDPRLAYEPAPYLATRRWVWEKWLEWGRGNSPKWDSRVLGEFPQQSEYALIWLSWITDARTRRLEAPSDKCVAGIDVAGPGECDTVLCIRNGPRIVFLRGWGDADPRGAVMAVLAPYKGRLTSVNVDAAGIGYGLALHLQDHGYPVRFINVGEKANDPERYKNLKAELYWGLRERFEQGNICADEGLLDDDKAVPQLSGLQYEQTASGQVQIESKEDAMERGMESPDYAEAIMLCYAADGGMPLATGLRSEAYEPTKWAEVR